MRLQKQLIKIAANLLLVLLSVQSGPAFAQGSPSAFSNSVPTDAKSSVPAKKKKKKRLAPSPTPSPTLSPVPSVSPSGTPTPVEHSYSFRTPAKQYGSAYSVKVSLRRDGTEYVAPFWVKPDEEHSSMDRKQMVELGWYFQDTQFDEALVSGHLIALPKLKNEKADWAFIPEFPRSCCFGVLGQDILNHYTIRFDPNKPAHLEWTEISTFDKPIARKIEHKWNVDLKSLFSYRTDQASYLGDKIDMGDTPYIVDFDQRTVTVEPAKVSPEIAKIARKTPLFSFDFMIPWRKLKIYSLASDVQKSAKSVGLKTGSIIWEIDGISTVAFNEFEVERILKGKKEAKVNFLFSINEKTQARKTITFDFEKNEWSEPKTL